MSNCIILSKTGIPVFFFPSSYQKQKSKHLLGQWSNETVLSQVWCARKITRKPGLTAQWAIFSLKPYASAIEINIRLNQKINNWKATGSGAALRMTLAPFD